MMALPPMDQDTASRVHLLEASNRIQMANRTLYVLLTLLVLGFIAFVYAVFNAENHVKALTAGFEGMVGILMNRVTKHLFPTSGEKRWWEHVFGTRTIKPID